MATPFADPSCLIFRIIEEKLNEVRCEKSCVRFCCEDANNCNLNISYMIEAQELNSNHEKISDIKCSKPTIIENEWKFLENGKILQIEDNSTLEQSEYCIDFSTTSKNHYAKKCFTRSAVRKIYDDYPYFIFASVPFFLFTIFVFSYFKELRNLSGKCLICFATSMNLNLILLALINIFRNLPQENNAACKVLGYSFSLTSWMSFLWLSVMGHDISSALSTQHKINTNKKFRFYCLYAFGIPILIVLFMIITHEFGLIAEEFSHNIGTYICLSASHNYWSNLVYTFLPMIYTIVINSVLSSITGFKIYKIKFNRIKRRHDHHEKERYFLFVRLFGIMGVFWIIEVLSFFIQDNVFLYGLCNINNLQGFFLFTIFVWTQRVKEIMKKRFPSCKFFQYLEAEKNQLDDRNTQNMSVTNSSKISS